MRGDTPRPKKSKSYCNAIIIMRVRRRRKSMCHHLSKHMGPTHDRTCGCPIRVTFAVMQNKSSASLFRWGCNRRVACNMEIRLRLCLVHTFCGHRAQAHDACVPNVRVIAGPVMQNRCGPRFSLVSLVERIRNGVRGRPAGDVFCVLCVCVCARTMM